MMLKHRVAIVTGAGRGIGAATAIALADAGATVAAVDIDSGLAAHTADAIVRRGGRSLALAVDVGDVTAIRSMVDTVTAASDRWTSWSTMPGLPAAPTSWT